MCSLASSLFLDQGVRTGLDGPQVGPVLPLRDILSGYNWDSCVQLTSNEVEARKDAK